MSRTRLRVAAKSDVGRARDHNEDSLGYRQAPDGDLVAERLGDLFVVCDGMGGHAAGEVASRLAVETILTAYYEEPALGPAASLAKAIQLANERIYAQAAERKEQQGMGTTCVALVILGDHLIAGHVGDSRAYLASGGPLRPLTIDHSWVNEQVALGLLEPDKARAHPMVNIITRALGHTPWVAVEVSEPVPIAAGDRALLCSDGLTGQVSDEEINDLLCTERPLEDIADELIRLANERGGPDNITALVVAVDAALASSGSGDSQDGVQADPLKTSLLEMGPTPDSSRSTLPSPVAFVEAETNPGFIGAAEPSPTQPSLESLHDLGASQRAETTSKNREGPNQRRISLGCVAGVVAVLLVAVIGGAAVVGFVFARGSLGPIASAVGVPLPGATTSAPSPTVASPVPSVLPVLTWPTGSWKNERFTLPPGTKLVVTPGDLTTSVYTVPGDRIRGDFARVFDEVLLAQAPSPCTAPGLPEARRAYWLLVRIEDIPRIVEGWVSSCSVRLTVP